MDALHRQRVAAAAKGTAVRIDRASLKRELKQRRLSIREVLTTPPPALRSATIREVLKATPGLGGKRVDIVLRKARASHTITLDGLGAAGRARILQTLIERYPKLPALR